MALEIERRFLVLPDKLPKRAPRGDLIVQGFLSFEPVVRIRILKPAKGKPCAFLTVKGKGLRIRAEYEYEIPLADARRLLKLTSGYLIEKTRIPIGPWTIDRYAGRHRGLWTAEIEFKSRRAELPKPAPVWLGMEVTSDPFYTNSRLARLPKWTGHPKAK